MLRSRVVFPVIFEQLKNSMIHKRARQIGFYEETCLLESVRLF